MVKNSQPGYRSQLSIFSLAVTDISIPSANYLTFTSSTNLQDSLNPVIFNIPPAINSYYDLANSYLYVKVSEQ